MSNLLDYDEQVKLLALKKFTMAYIECACWVNEFVGDLDIESTVSMTMDCVAFFSLSEHLMENLKPEQCGHDFYLTRNGHGSNFWDRGYKKILSDKLTHIAKSFGTDYTILPQGEDE
jgi:hypothetical protein